MRLGADVDGNSPPGTMDENGSDTNDITHITFVFIFLSRFGFEYGYY
jgi:hypothetical protein